jgi:hypothetical protein
MLLIAIATGATGTEDYLLSCGRTFHTLLIRHLAFLMHDRLYDETVDLALRLRRVKSLVRRDRIGLNQSSSAFEQLSWKSLKFS